MPLAEAHREADDRERDPAGFLVAAGELSLARPGNGVRAGLPKGVAMNLVDVREIDPPQGEKAVHWRLLTTHAVTSPDEAFAVVDLYRRRWAIEQSFRTLKTQGFDIENLDRRACTAPCAGDRGRDRSRLHPAAGPCPRRRARAAAARH